MVEINKQTKVADIVVQNPETRPILERMGIDYCCGGKLTLRKAAENLGLVAEDVIRDLSKVTEDGSDKQQYRNWSSESVTKLADYIEKTHHSFMKEQLPRLEQLLEKTLNAHKEKHSQMLTELKETYAVLKSEIELHLAKEEQILFPFIRQIDSFQQNQTDRPELHCGSIENPISQMEYEHDNAGKALDKMRRITSDYKLPDDACNTFKALYDGLKALEADLHEHIHLENNILFPKAIELEKSI
jgi:regulator of cell morphogenesis and NO signaling